MYAIGRESEQRADCLVDHRERERERDCTRFNCNITYCATTVSNYCGGTSAMGIASSSEKEE
jgi:hypothetical protein